MTLPDPIVAHVVFILVTLATVVGFLKGDEPERIGAGAYALALFSTLLMQEPLQPREPQIPLALIDAGLLIVYAALAWRSRRAWPVWAAAVQALAVMAHLLMLAGAGPDSLALYDLIRLANLAVLGILCVGVVQAWRDRVLDARHAARAAARD